MKVAFQTHNLSMEECIARLESLCTTRTSSRKGFDISPKANSGFSLKKLPSMPLDPLFSGVFLNKNMETWIYGYIGISYRLRAFLVGLAALNLTLAMYLWSLVENDESSIVGVLCLPLISLALVSLMALIGAWWREYRSTPHFIAYIERAFDAKVVKKGWFNSAAKRLVH